MDEINRFEKYFSILERIATRGTLEKRKRDLIEELTGYEQCLPDIKENYNNQCIKDVIDQYQLLKKEHDELKTKRPRLMMNLLIGCVIAMILIITVSPISQILMIILSLSCITIMLFGGAWGVLPVPYRENGKILFERISNNEEQAYQKSLEIKKVNSELDTIELQPDQYINEWQDAVDELEDVNRKLDIITELETTLKSHPEYDLIIRAHQGRKFDIVNYYSLNDLENELVKKPEKTARGRRREKTTSN